MVCHEREFYEALGAQIWDCQQLLQIINLYFPKT